MSSEQTAEAEAVTNVTFDATVHGYCGKFTILYCILSPNAVSTN